MFRPLILYIGLRYTRAKRRNQFISFISLVSMIGIALGVVVLITVLSVMNGFDQQIKEKIFTMVPHVTVSGVTGKLSNWKQLDKKVKVFPDVLSSAPFISGQGLISKDGVVRPVMTQGVLPTSEGKVSAITKSIVAGRFSDLKSGGFGIVLGQNLALNLGVIVGDKINFVAPQATVTPMGIIPRFKRFTVVGIFKVGSGFGFDDNYAFINLHDAQVLFSLGQQISGLQLKIPDLFKAQYVSHKLEQKLGYKYQVSNWTEQYGAFYHAVQMEKNMMFLILLLLIAIAAFNLVSSLVMLVNDKRADIAILRTFGATPKMVTGIFVVQGMIVGITGTLLGLIGGVLLSLNVTAVVNFIQNTFHVELFTANVYFVNYLPSQLLISDLTHICTTALLMSFLATIYPAWRAARIQPMDALRYE